MALATVASWRHAASSDVGSNVLSGVTVALVALPLNMALALACGLPASVGLITGAIAGVLGALLGGSRFQITGPEVALAPVTFEVVSKHGLEGLLAVTLMAGAIQIGLGLFRVGRLVHSIPVPVIAGFLAAVGIMVLDSQIPVLLGVSAEARMVTDLRISTLQSVSGVTLAVGVFVIALMFTLPRLGRRIPVPLVALVVAAGTVAALGLPVPMVDSFEGGFMAPRVPEFDIAVLPELATEALALALIASIDSLLCAASIDSRTGGPRTNMDQELVAQGVANIGSACCGGMPVAAAIVRSAAAVEAGATSRVAPLTQSLVLAMVVVALGPLMSTIPLVALAGILLVIGWRLIDWKLLHHMWTSARLEVGALVATAIGILLTDFARGVALGVLVALAVFAYRQRKLVKARRLVSREEVEGAHILHFEGPLFFASQDQVDRLFDGIDDDLPVVIDLSRVPTLDSSAAMTLCRAIDRLLAAGHLVSVAAPPADASSLLAPTLEKAGTKLSVSASVAEGLGSF